MRSLPGSAYYTRTEKLVTCKRCGQTGLVWTQNKSGKWYLAHTIRSQDDMKDQAGVVVAAPWIRHDCNETRRAHEAVLEQRRKDLQLLENFVADIDRRTKNLNPADETEGRALVNLEQCKVSLEKQIETERSWIEIFDRGGKP